jgi:hypothetical protein
MVIYLGLLKPRFLLYLSSLKKKLRYLENEELKFTNIYTLKPNIRLFPPKHFEKGEKLWVKIVATPNT